MSRLYQTLVAARAAGASWDEIKGVADEYVKRNPYERPYFVPPGGDGTKKRKPGATTRARWQDILDALPGSTDVVAQRAEVQPDTARRDLRRMRERGMVEGDGSWWERAR